MVTGVCAGQSGGGFPAQARDLFFSEMPPPPLGFAQSPNQRIMFFFFSKTNRTISDHTSP